ncbi:MAG: Gldg family protein [Acidobacteriota bacterium]
MEILKSILNYVGGILIIAGGICYRVWPQKKYLFLFLFAAGLISLFVYFYLNREKFRERVKIKYLLYSGNIFLILLLVLAIVGSLNYLFSKVHYRIDLTEGKIHSLSDQSIKVLKNLKKDVVITGFFREGKAQRAKMEDFLKNYRYYSNKIRYTVYDPDKNPGLVKEYNVSEDGTTIFKCNNNETRITGVSEEDITNAIIKVTREERKTIYFSKGHGEFSIADDSDRGYSQAKKTLEELGYNIKEIFLAEEPGFPHDCVTFVAAGPKKDFLPQELSALERYLKNGGRSLLMLDPQDSPSFISFLKKWGVNVGDDFIVDTVSRILGGDYLMPVVSQYSSHPITEKFRYATFFPYARSVEVLNPAPEGITAQVIGSTSPNSWASTQFGSREISFNPEKDRKGPVPIVVSSTWKAEGETKKEGRLIVFGDSDFASNQFYNLSGNGNFFTNSLNWLAEEIDLIAISPKTAAPRTIQLTASQGRFIFYTILVIIPGLFIIMGIFIYFRRRSL